MHIYIPLTHTVIADKLSDIQKFMLSQLFTGATITSTPEHSVLTTDHLKIEDFVFLNRNNISIKDFYPQIEMSIEDGTRTLLDITPVIPGRYVNDKPVTWLEWSTYTERDGKIRIDTAGKNLRQHHLIAINNLSYARLI